MLNFIAKAAITIGLTAANMVLTMSRKIEGPRQDDLKVTSGDYGNPLAMAWGMVRKQCPIFWAEDLKEVKEEHSSKGGKITEYKYYGTWAVAIAGHEIQAVRRIWFDTKLVLDLSGVGPATPFDWFADRAGTKYEDKDAPWIDMTLAKTKGKAGFYSGAEDQEPDDRIKAWVEAKHGEGSCPAYRGTAYLVFKEVPLEKWGNRIPQVAVEFLAHDYSFSIPTQTVADPLIDTWQAAVFSTDYSRLLLIKQNYASGLLQYEIWDVGTRTPLIWGEVAEFYGKVAEAVGMYKDGRFVLVGDSGASLYAFDADGLGRELLLTDMDPHQDGVYVLADGQGTEHVITYSDIFPTFYQDGAEINYIVRPSHYFADSYGDIWGIFQPDGFSTTVTFIRLVNAGGGIGWPDTFAITGLPSGYAVTSFATHVHAPSGDFFVFTRGGGLNYVVDPATGTVISTADVGPAGGISSYRAVWQGIVPGSSTYWVYGTEISLVTGEVVRSPLGSSEFTEALYDPVNHALIVNSAAGEETWHFFDRVGNDGVTLGTIAAGLAEMVGAEDVDFSDLDQVIPGWSATQGQASAILEPLLDTYDSDIRPHEFTIQGVKRTGISGATLLTERFVGSPRYAVKVRQAAELPRAVTINFADLDADQQPNNVRVGRPLDATGARGEKSVDLSTLSLSPDAARDLGDRYFRRFWNERKGVTLGLTAQQLALEPGDVRTLDLDGEQMTARLTKLTVKADDSLATEWVYDHASLASLNGGIGAAFDGRDPSVISVPMISKGFVLDLPLLTDAHNSTNPLLYVAAGPYVAGSWPGAAVLQQTSGGEYSEEVASFSSTSAATWGYTNAVLGDANPNLWDRLSSLNVTVKNGTLSGCTESDINAVPTRNLALIGDELVNFTTATLESDGTYTLSGFKRGRRGTEWATGAHAVTDRFLLLSHVGTATKGLSDVGTAMSFKAVTSGRSATSAFPIDIAEYSGASLKPYAPCDLTGIEDSGDWVLSWVRRTRVGGAWTSSSTISLGETAEEYEVELMDGSSVAHTYTGLTSPSLTVSSADQTSYLGGPASSLTFRVYQISSAVGRGFVASATV